MFQALSYLGAGLLANLLDLLELLFSRLLGVLLGLLIAAGVLGLKGLELSLLLRSVVLDLLLGLGLGVLHSLGAV